MSPHCIDAERIADVETSPDLQRHVAECPRCESLWLSYQSFMQADVSGADKIDAARRKLAETIKGRAAASTVEAAPRVSFQTRRRVQLAWLRPGLIAAAAAVIAAVAISVWRGSSDQPVLRGGSQAEWSLETPHVSGIAVVFKWSPVPKAETYEVEIYDDALNLVLHSAAVTTPSISVDRGALSKIPPGTELTWRVRALKGGDVMATSPPSSLTLQ